jgi:hypothetical protein
MLGLQSVVITAGTLKLLPLTGVTLPFVSYGGSSLVTSFLMVGLLLFVANNPTPWRQPASVVRPPIFHVQLARAILIGFLIVAGGLILWQVAAASFLVSRPDNPRRVVAEQRVDRGRLLTHNGIPIAETVINRDGLAQRRYPYPSLSSVTGYYSLRYGVGGTEAAFDTLLRGAVSRTPEQEFVDELLHRPLVGHDVTLTIDLPAQVAADVALGQREGAVVVIEIETGAVLVMSSHPTYDPNTLDETWDSLRLDRRAPLLNRATQGLFPVGELSRLVGLVGLHEAGATIPADALHAPLDDLLAPLGPTGYLATVHQLGLTDLLPDLPSQPARLPNFPPEGEETGRDLAVTPLHLARVAAALELGGRLPDPLLSQNVEPRHERVIQPTTAEAIRSLLPQVDAQMIGLPAQASPEETGQTWLSWFVGLAPAAASPQPTGPSPALTEDGLIFDPTRIATVTPSPTRAVTAPPSRARYVVVAVVVTETPDRGLALRVARAPLKVLLGSK